MLLLDITVVNVALPDIQRSLHSSFSDLQWVVNVTSDTKTALAAGAPGRAVLGATHQHLSGAARGSRELSAAAAHAASTGARRLCTCPPAPAPARAAAGSGLQALGVGDQALLGLIPAAAQHRQARVARVGWVVARTGAQRKGRAARVAHFALVSAVIAEARRGSGRTRLARRAGHGRSLVSPRRDRPMPLSLTMQL
jgi:hypothetical protein